jgi:adenosylhomocysteine nucleosidase
MNTTQRRALRFAQTLLLLLFILTMLRAPASAARHYDVMVQGALDVELQPLLTALEGRKIVQLDAWTFWTGRIGDKNVVVCRTEVGPLNATAATAIGIRYFQPRILINQGTAGGHNRALKLWDIVVGERTIDFSGVAQVHGDDGSGIHVERWQPMYNRLRLDGRNQVTFESFAGDKALVKAALEIPYARGHVIAGSIGSAFHYSRELDYIDWVRRVYKTDSEDMESAFAAGVATAMHVRFVAVRIISDTEWEHATFERIAGEYCAEFVARMIRALPRRTTADR